MGDKGDIYLPNQSGVVDPRIPREAELRRQRDFLRQAQAPPKPKPSVASRMLEARSALIKELGRDK